MKEEYSFKCKGCEKKDKIQFNDLSEINYLLPLYCKECRSEKLKELNI